MKMNWKDEAITNEERKDRLEEILLRLDVELEEYNNYITQVVGRELNTEEFRTLADAFYNHRHTAKLIRDREEEFNRY